MNSKSKDIIFLIGAGASAEAGIPVSNDMISKIEELLARNNDWEGYRPLYNHVKSAIHYSAGLQGRYRDDVIYNIEVLANTLNELARNEEHPIYPFVASWNGRFNSLAGPRFKQVQDFYVKILNQLKEWVQPESMRQAQYYAGFRRLQQTLGFPLKVFSLNYDCCFERVVAGDDFRVETGFAGDGQEHYWEWRRFEEPQVEADRPEIYLYKLHGSINWKRDAAGNLVAVDHAGTNIPAAQMQVIFGREFKLEAGDPYLFYAFEFRRSTLDARVIVTVGYGFGDEHINKMLRQALRCDPTKRLVSVVRCAKDSDGPPRARHIAKTLDVPEASVQIIPGTAKEFLMRSDIGETVQKLLPELPKAEF